MGPPGAGLRATPRWRRAIGLPGRIVRWGIASADRHVQNIVTALVQVWVHKARSLLTTLGIIIAVTSTITVVSFVQGFGNHVTDMLRGFGTNMIFVIPEFGSGMRGRMLGRVQMDIHDVRAVTAQCDKVRRISPLSFTNVSIEYGREKSDSVELQGVAEQWQTIRRYDVDRGRFFSAIDVDGAAHVCVLGREVLRKLQCDEKIVGDYVYLGGLRFLVLGLLEAKGSMMGETLDDLVVIPFTTAIQLNPWARVFMPFVLEVTSESDVDEASLQIAQVLRERHDIQPGAPNDFRILRQDEFIRDLESVKTAATGVLSGIVGISLVVGGIGIMNVMLISVSERTHEIGLRKSVGGRRRDILAQFLTEAVVLAMAGGAIGIALGYAICAVASKHPSMVPIVVPPWVVALALAFSAGIGILFGIIPAFKAAILHPIDALRHE
ncbi:MAG: FtsX-like permease family protein [Phycisphaerales bacterium]|nr:FtsX-like permease family protein [Phycisphaerales bacterium]